MHVQTLTLLATLSRYLQFVSHIGHHLTQGLTFFSDHAFLNELYLAYESQYDIIAERMVGLDLFPDLANINIDAAKALTNSTTPFATLLDIERKFCIEVKVAMPLVSEGTANMLAQFADDSEVRQYKINQRLK